MTTLAISKWSIETRLAAAALALGLVAVFGDPSGGDRVSLNTRELGVIVESKVDHVTVEELASWIVEGRNDYRLLDVRDAAAYAEYHIPTAELAPLTALSDYPIFRNEKIVLYSDGGIHSAQAWFLLAAKGYDGAYILFGGLDEWKDVILFPALPVNASVEETDAFQRLSHVSRFFGGTPRTEGSATVESGPVKMPDAPGAPAVPVQPRKRKRKEGC
jgi:rhodanese-related sulfurtransferase